MGGLLPGKNLEAKIALAIYVAARVDKKPRCMSEILHYCSTRSSEVNSCLKKTQSILFTNVDMRQHAEDLSDRVTWKLGLHYDVRQQVRETVLNLKEHMEGKPPKTIVAVALFWVVSHTRTLSREEKMVIMDSSFEAVDITKATL